MRYIRFVIIAVSLLLIGTSGIAVAQMASVSYALTGGTPVGGGGASTSSGYSLTGSVPVTGAGILGSSSYTISSGNAAVFSAGTAFNAAYAGTQQQTVNISARTLNVTYQGGTGSVSGTFFYRLGGNTAFTSIPMTASDLQTLTVEVEPGLLTIRGLEYYFVITDGSTVINIGNPASVYAFKVEVNNEQGQRPTPMPNATNIGAYRIIGVPLVANNNSASAVFPDDLGPVDSTSWRLGSYNPETGQVDEYPDVERVNPGQGFWLIAPGDKTYGTAGVSVYPNVNYNGYDYFNVPLDSGWNQLANPFPFNVAWSEVVFIDGVDTVGHIPSVLEDEIFRYTSSGYTTVNAIPAWEGVFVKINKSGIKALIRFHETAIPLRQSPPVEPPVSRDSWAVGLKLEVDGMIDDYNFVGVKPGALDGLDIYDKSEPPILTGAPRLAFRNADLGQEIKRTDFRSPFSDGAVWDIDLSNASGGKISFSGIDRIPLGMEAWLLIGSGTRMKIEDNTVFTVPVGLQSAQLIIGNREFADANDAGDLPDHFELGQNFPNPFNPVTEISFALPEPGHVRLEIFNILGQSIRVLADAELPAGRHRISWDGRDHDGINASSGIYFYRIDYGNLTKTRKMVMLK